MIQAGAGLDVLGHAKVASLTHGAPFMTAKTEIASAATIGQILIDGSKKYRKLSDMETLLLMDLLGDHEGELAGAVLEKHFLGQVMASRAAHHGIQAEPQVLAWLAGASKTPGEVVLFLTILHALQRQTRHETLTLRQVLPVFRKGLPSAAQFDEVWDLQKNTGCREPETSDNHLDADASWTA